MIEGRSRERTGVLRNANGAELAALAEITLRTNPTVSTPLVVYVTGAAFDGRTDARRQA